MEEDKLLTPKNLNIIENLTIKIHQSEFIVLLGKVGSGKSALLQGLINNMHKTNGEVFVGGSVAYVEPEPVILSDSIKNNITFGKEFNQELYDNVI